MRDIIELIRSVDEYVIRYVRHTVSHVCFVVFFFVIVSIASFATGVWLCDRRALVEA